MNINLSLSPRLRLKWISALICAAVLVTPLWAQDNFPSKAVKIFVPYAAGGNTDVTTRLFAKGMSDSMGQQFLVENRPGGSTNIAAEATAKSVPDGYTLFVLQGTSHGTNPWIFPKLPYDPIKDFSFIALMAKFPFYLVVNASLPVNSVRELVNYAKASPGKYAYASPGNFTATHLAAAVLVQREGMGSVTHVPYKGDAPAIVDIMGGRVLFMFSAGALSFVKQGKLKALAVADNKRWPLAPEIPSMQEAGVPDLEVSSYFGLGGPAKIPEAVQEKLNRAMVEVSQRDDTRKLLAEMGAIPLIGTRAETAAYIVNEIAKWQSFVKLSGVKIDD